MFGVILFYACVDLIYGSEGFTCRRQIGSTYFNQSDHGGGGLRISHWWGSPPPLTFLLHYRATFWGRVGRAPRKFSKKIEHFRNFLKVVQLTNFD